MVAFQKPTTVHGKVRANRARNTMPAADSGDAACSYSLTLQQPRGTSFGYTLHVRTRLFNTVGDVSAVAWNFVRCAATEYAVLSSVAGNDSVVCMPCPVGGDCSGDGATVGLNLTSAQRQAREYSIVVTASDILAQPQVGIERGVLSVWVATIGRRCV